MSNTACIPCMRLIREATANSEIAWEIARRAATSGAALGGAAQLPPSSALLSPQPRTKLPWCVQAVIKSICKLAIDRG